jgi:MFS transporter, SP family, general alpha glucoside:H+ symporter
MLLTEAEDAIKEDHELTILQAIKLYPKAIGWAATVAASSLVDGYDYHVQGSLFAQPAFQKTYGDLQPDGSYVISAAWQSEINNGSTVGTLIGLYLAGYLSDKFGFRITIMLSLFFAFGFIFIQFFANSLAMLEVGQILLGEVLACQSFMNHSCEDFQH